MEKSGLSMEAVNVVSKGKIQKTFPKMNVTRWEMEREESRMSLIQVWVIGRIVVTLSEKLTARAIWR